jgi:Tol biopolymer transport system component
VFSPDGQRILYVTDRATRSIASKRGGDLKSLGAPVSEPAWQAS